jgi:hypothetical protein
MMKNSLRKATPIRKFQKGSEANEKLKPAGKKSTHSKLTINHSLSNNDNSRNTSLNLHQLSKLLLAFSSISDLVFMSIAGNILNLWPTGLT